MRFRITNVGDGFALIVEDGESVVLSVPTATLTEAKAIQRRAVIDGLEAVREVRPDTKASKKKKVN